MVALRISGRPQVRSASACAYRSPGVRPVCLAMRARGTRRALPGSGGVRRSRGAPGPGRRSPLHPDPARAQHTWQSGNLGDPAPAFFAFEFDRESHAHNVPSPAGIHQPSRVLSESACTEKRTSDSERATGAAAVAPEALRRALRSHGVGGSGDRRGPAPRQGSGRPEHRRRTRSDCVRGLGTKSPDQKVSGLRGSKPIDHRLRRQARCKFLQDGGRNLPIASLAPERHIGIDRRGAAGGQVAGEKRGAD